MAAPAAASAPQAHIEALSDELLQKIVAQLPPGDCKAARLACSRLCRAVDADVSAIAILHPGFAAVRAGVLCASVRAQRWPRVRRLTLSSSIYLGDLPQLENEWRPLQEAFEALKRAWPLLTSLQVVPVSMLGLHYSQSITGHLDCMLAAWAACNVRELDLAFPRASLMSPLLLLVPRMCTPDATLRVLRLWLEFPLHGLERADMAPLLRLTRLEELSLRARTSSIAGPFLPPSLRSLRLGGPGCGAAWLNCIGACTRLTRLEFAGLSASDLGLDEDPDLNDPALDLLEADEAGDDDIGLPDGLLRAHAVLGSLTSLRHLSGVLLLGEDGPLCSKRLLPKLTNLTELTLYSDFPPPDEGGWAEPALFGAWPNLDHLSNLQALAFDAGRARGRWPRTPMAQLRRLHVTSAHSNSYPPSLEEAFPALEELIVADACASCAAHVPPFAAVAGLPGLTRLAVSSGRRGLFMPDRISALTTAPALRVLELHGFGWCRSRRGVPGGAGAAAGGAGEGGGGAAEGAVGVGQQALQEFIGQQLQALGLPFDLDDVVGEVVGEVEAQLEAQGLQLIMQPPGQQQGQQQQGQQQPEQQQPGQEQQQPQAAQQDQEQQQEEGQQQQLLQPLQQPPQQLQLVLGGGAALQLGIQPHQPQPAELVPAADVAAAAAAPALKRLLLCGCNSAMRELADWLPPGGHPPVQVVWEAAAPRRQPCLVDVEALAGHRHGVWDAEPPPLISDSDSGDEGGSEGLGPGEESGPEND